MLTGRKRRSDASDQHRRTKHPASESEACASGVDAETTRHAVGLQTLATESCSQTGLIASTRGSFEELRSLESIVKNPNRDASLLFDVKLERIKAKL